MKNNYSIQIQKETQEIDRLKRDIEIINMQINSITNRIIMSARPVNVPRYDKSNFQKLNPRISNIKSNDSMFPQLNSNRQLIANQSRVAYSAMPQSNTIESNEIRYPVSEPHKFYRSPRNYCSIIGNSNNNNISRDESSYDSNCNDTSSNNSVNDDVINKSNLIDYSNSSNISRKSMINNSDSSFNENKTDIHDSSARINSMNIEPDATSDINQQYKKVTKIYLRQRNEIRKTDQKITDVQVAATDEADDYMNEIDEIISDNFENQKSDDEEN